MMRRMLVPGLLLIAGAVLVFLGVGGLLALTMIAGGPNPPPAEQSGRHALLWYSCVLVGVVIAIAGVVRAVSVLRRGRGGGN